MPHIDLDACTRRGIVVCAGSGSPYAPAELTLALILAATRLHRRRRRRAPRRHLADDDRPRAARTRPRDRGLRLDRRARRRLRTRARDAGARLGTRGVARAGPRGRARARARPRGPLRAAPTSSASISSCRRRRAGIITARHLGLMKPDALFVNTARAGTDRAGCPRRRARRRPARERGDRRVRRGAGHSRPTRPATPRVLATPHLGYVTWETYESVLRPGVRAGRRVRGGRARRRRQPRGARVGG